MYIAIARVKNCLEGSSALYVRIRVCVCITGVCVCVWGGGRGREGDNGKVEIGSSMPAEI